MSAVCMLEDLGHTVIEANSPQRTLEILEAEQAVYLMMTDQAMPGMTGVELAEIVRGKRPNMPVLLATGYADLPHRRSRTCGVYQSRISKRNCRLRSIECWRHHSSWGRDGTKTRSRWSGAINVGSSIGRLGTDRN
jgi:Response regulator receiver domain